MISDKLQARNGLPKGTACKGCIFKGELRCRNNLRLGAPLTGCDLYRPYPDMACICVTEGTSSGRTRT